MRYGSVCSGIEAVTQAWHPLGLEAAWFAEIEPFPCAVLAHHYPTVPNLGDMTLIAARILAGEVEAPDILVGGTPCQSFSVAGLRGGLGDHRGNLALAFVELADAVDLRRRNLGLSPAWILWENVPGALNVDEGRAFGSILGGLCGSDDSLSPGAGWSRAGLVSGPTRRTAWRHLDARYHSLAQRRDRLFVLSRGGSGDWTAPEALLPLVPRSEWHPAPSRASRPGASARPAGRAPVGRDLAGGLCANGKAAGSATKQDAEQGLLIPEIAYCVTGGPGGNQFGTGRDGQDTFIPEVSGALGGHHPQGDLDTSGAYVPELAHALTGEGFDASEDGTGRGTPIIPFDTTQITHPENRSNPQDGDPSPTLAKGGHAPAIAFRSTHSNGGILQDDTMLTLSCSEPAPVMTLAVRGRGEGRDLEVRDDGTANALVTPNGGRDGMGVGAIAYSITPEGGQGADLRATEVDTAPALGSKNEQVPGYDRGVRVVAPALTTNDPSRSPTANEVTRQVEAVHASSMAVRRLTPVECARLQGFPDHFLDIPGSTDSAKYRALGNSMAVPVMAYLGRRILAVASR